MSGLSPSPVVVGKPGSPQGRAGCQAATSSSTTCQRPSIFFQILRKYPAAASWSASLVLAAAVSPPSAEIAPSGEAKLPYTYPRSPDRETNPRLAIEFTGRDSRPTDDCSASSPIRGG